MTLSVAPNFHPFHIFHFLKIKNVKCVLRYIARVYGRFMEKVKFKFSKIGKCVLAAYQDSARVVVSPVFL